MSTIYHQSLPIRMNDRSMRAVISLYTSHWSMAQILHVCRWTDGWVGRRAFTQRGLLSTRENQASGISPPQHTSPLSAIIGGWGRLAGSTGHV